MTNLYHYTCDHGREALGDLGQLRTAAELMSPAKRDSLDPGLVALLSWCWLTDLATPHRDALGLTSHTLGCDRAAHRYQVVLPTKTGAIRWTGARRYFRADLREELESAPGAMPRHWYIAPSGVQVVHFPLLASALVRP